MTIRWHSVWWMLLKLASKGLPMRFRLDLLGLRKRGPILRFQCPPVVPPSRSGAGDTPNHRSRHAAWPISRGLEPGTLHVVKVQGIAQAIDRRGAVAEGFVTHLVATDLPWVRRLPRHRRLGPAVRRQVGAENRGHIGKQPLLELHPLIECGVMQGCRATPASPEMAEP
jgi:hypothetical protein